MKTILTANPLLVRESGRQMRELFADPARHTTGVCARNAAGEQVTLHHPDAVCWCFIGGAGVVERRLSRGDGITFGDAMCAGLDYENLVNDKAEAVFGRRGIVHVNDDRGHAAILALIDTVNADLAAIEAA